MILFFVSAEYSKLFWKVMQYYKYVFFFCQNGWLKKYLEYFLVLKGPYNVISRVGSDGYNGRMLKSHHSAILVKKNSFNMNCVLLITYERQN